MVCESDALLHIAEVRQGEAACAVVGMKVAAAPWFPSGQGSGRVGERGTGVVVRANTEAKTIMVRWDCGDRTVWTRASWEESDVVAA